MLVPGDPVPDVPYSTRIASWTTTMRNGLSVTNKRVVHPNEVVREALDQVAMLNCKVSSIGLEMEKVRLRVTDLSEELGQAKLRAKAAQPQPGQHKENQELGSLVSALRADMAIVQAELRERSPERAPQPHSPHRQPLSPHRRTSPRKMDAASLLQAPEDIDRLRARLNSAVELTHQQAWGAPRDEWGAQRDGQMLRDMEAFGGEELQEALDELAQSQGRLLEHVASQAVRVHRVESKVAKLDEKVQTSIIASEKVHMLVNMPEAYQEAYPEAYPETYNRRGRPMFDCGGPRFK